MLITPEQIAKAEQAGIIGIDLATSTAILEARTAGLTYPQFLEPITGTHEQQAAHLTEQYGSDAVRLALVLARG
jgi:hypothetical protein